MTTILVTGGTGKLGRPLVARLREDGQDVRVLSRRDPHHPVGEVVEGEEGLHPLRVGLVALHRVQLRHHDAGELGATARD
ncbi:NAD-dependent epimerase/dehydratase family protein, partial [Streptomyces albidoflavus]|uniref:NAD-dependent epimerase/dehydratase family protein n=1 Tax=Streptomyces albidoflavus TaxID=1886 RepID=UPI00117C4952